jgi:hypothetical protein
VKYSLQTGSGFVRRYSTHGHIFTLFSIAVLFLGGRSEGCSRFFRTFAVRPDFAVDIKLRVQSEKGTPLSRVRVRLSPQNGNDVSSVSTSNGKAYFGSLQPGHYFRVVAMAGVESDAADLEVSSDHLTAQDRLEFGWPSREIMPVREISGRLSSSMLSKQAEIIAKAPLAGAKLTLLNTQPGITISTTATNENGDERFSDVPDGLYVLHITQPDSHMGTWDVEGDSIARVSSQASLAHLPPDFQ